MTLTLYFHPLASFCHKALIALDEKALPFEPVIVDLGDERSRAAFEAVWSLGKMPVLRDEARNCTVAESTVVVEYLDSFHPGARRLLPTDPELAWRARLWDRFFDFYVQQPMQKIVTDRLRPPGSGDAWGVEQAEGQLRQSYALLERELDRGGWMTGGDFTLADCAAAPALLYAETVLAFGPSCRHLPAYLERLLERPSVARVFAEAEPYFAFFPLERKPRLEKGRPAG